MVTQTSLIGTFLFETLDSKLTLKGDYLNYIDYKREKETATRQNSSGSDPFEGIYQTTWKEKGKPYTATLTITVNQEGYDMVWSKISPGGIGFKGIGINYKGTLIGGYWLG